MKSLLLVLFTPATLLMANAATAQNRNPEAEAQFALKPLWIGMMDDTLANFFVVERAFETYFNHHKMPDGEHEVIG